MLPLLAALCEFVVLYTVGAMILKQLRQHRPGDKAQAKRIMVNVAACIGVLLVATLATFYVFFAYLSQDWAILVSLLILAGIAALIPLIIKEGNKKLAEKPSSE